MGMTRVRPVIQWLRSRLAPAASAVFILIAAAAVPRDLADEPLGAAPEEPWDSAPTPDLLARDGRALAGEHLDQRGR